MGIFGRPRMTIVFWLKRRTCSPTGGRMVSLLYLRYDTPVCFRYSFLQHDGYDKRKFELSDYIFLDYKIPCCQFLASTAVDFL